MAIKTYNRGDNTQLSENFRVSEFLCKGAGCCASGKIDEELVQILQKIRTHFGKPVHISSAYRCETWNKQVGGVSGSYHRYGQAADIKVEDVAPAEVAKYAESIGVKGIGLYETDADGYFVHVDTRQKKSFWYGQAQQRRTTFGGAPAESDSYTLKQFVKDVQKACGAKVDGVAGKETLSKTVTLSAKKNRTHALVEFVQKRLYALGYTVVGKADGIAGAKFTAAVKAFQKDNNCTADGEITAGNKTWRKLLGMK